MPDGSRDTDLRRLAYSTLEIKSIDEDARTFEGIASTPSVDAGGDIMDPFGAVFSLPMPLFWQHGKQDIKDPIGWVTHAKPTNAGIFVKGAFAKIDAPASLKEQLDRAWALVKGKLVRGLSIGWRPIEGKPEKGGVVRWLKWGWHELSAVAIPMNVEATIQTVKSFSESSTGAAPGSSTQPRPGASGTPKPRSKTMPGITEKLSELQTKSVEFKSRMTELSQECEGDVEKLAPEQLNEFDRLNAELGPLEANIKRYEGMQRAASKASAIPSDAGTDPDRGYRVRNGDFQMKSNLPKGTFWTRAVLAQAYNRGSKSDAANYAKNVWRDSPEVAQYIMKANAGSGASGNWAENLNTPNFIENEFLEALFPMTIIGKLNMRSAPFDTKMLRQTGSSTVNWVANAAAKPVGELAFDYVTVPKSKMAGIIVLTDDQIKQSHINSVEAVRQDLIKQITKFADQQFTDPNVAAVAGTNPASVTNGVNDIPASGATAAAFRTDIQKMMNRFSAAEIGLDEVTLITSPYVANGVSMMYNSLGQQEFPGVTVRGGTLPNGMPVIVSNSVPGTSAGSVIIGIAAQEVLFANDGGIQVDSSNQATVDMAGGDTPTVSFWQKNLVGLRAEWFVSWIKGRTAAVQYISGAAYAA